MFVAPDPIVVRRTLLTPGLLAVGLLAALSLLGLRTSGVAADVLGRHLATTWQAALLLGAIAGITGPRIHWIRAVARRVDLHLAVEAGGDGLVVIGAGIYGWAIYRTSGADAGVALTFVVVAALPYAWQACAIYRRLVVAIHEENRGTH